MAERIDALPERGIRGGGVQDAWLDGSAWKLQQGTDYERTTKSMRSALAAGYDPLARAAARVSREWVDAGRAAELENPTPEQHAAFWGEAKRRAEEESDDRVG